MPNRFFRTLRFRLTLWNSLVVLFASLLALFAVREGMRMTLQHESRALLQEETFELGLAVCELHDDWPGIEAEFQRKVLSHSNHEWFSALLSEESNKAWQSENFPRDLLAEPFIRDWIEQPFEFRRTRQHTLVRRPIESDEGRPLAVLLGQPNRFIDNDFWDLTKLLLMIGAVLALIAPVGGYFLARHATQPVREIIKTTRSLDPARLNQRLTIRGTDDELDQISHEINLFVGQISKYLESYREFIANAAHELRSPMTAIQTRVDVTLDKDRSANEYREELETVSEQCQQLRHLINQLLDLAEIDAEPKKHDGREVRLDRLLRKSIDFFAGVAEEKRTSVHSKIKPDILLAGDESKLRQVINNLLDNAIKFTPKNGRIDIELTP